MTDENNLLASNPPASAAQTHAEIEAMLRHENLALRDEVEALRARLAAGDTQEDGAGKEGKSLAALKHRHAVELTLAHMRQIVWFAGHSAGVPSLDTMKTLLNQSEYFDPDWYRAQDAGLQQSGMDPAEHYLRAGAYEGRNPGPGFDTMAYYLANPDVAASSWPALLHYEAAGRAEGRVIRSV